MCVVVGVNASVVLLQDEHGLLGLHCPRMLCEEVLQVSVGWHVVVKGVLVAKCVGCCWCVCGVCVIG